MFSRGIEVDAGSREVELTEAKRQLHFAETGNLTKLKVASQLDKFCHSMW